MRAPAGSEDVETDRESGIAASGAAGYSAAMNELRFSCTGCGRCCTGGPNHYIEASTAEQRRIREYLSLSEAWFRRRYVVRVDAEMEGLRIEDNGRCVFLGRDGRCRIYPVRPAQCAHYPFWPELVADPGAWHAEALRCEGIGRGDVVPTARLRVLLRKQRAPQ